MHGRVRCVHSSWACCARGRALLCAQGMLSPRASAVHCHDISSMLQHGKSHVPRFSVATEDLEKSVATEDLEKSVATENCRKSVAKEFSLSRQLICRAALGRV